MADKRKKKRPRKSSGFNNSESDAPLRRRKTPVKSRWLPERKSWELVHPRCVRERAEDLEEVEQMLAAGETDVAEDELRWLLQGCSDFITAHRLLGELALGREDYRLARGHFGYAFEVGWSALPDFDVAPVLYNLPANQALLEGGKGLAFCLHELKKPARALSVLRRLLHWDSSDPLGVKPWLKQWADEEPRPNT